MDVFEAGVIAAGLAIAGWAIGLGLSSGLTNVAQAIVHLAEKGAKK